MDPNSQKIQTFLEALAKIKKENRNKAQNELLDILSRKDESLVKFLSEIKKEDLIVGLQEEGRDLLSIDLDPKDWGVVLKSIDLGRDWDIASEEQDESIDLGDEW